MAQLPSNPVKRRVKNPETFRERALKAAEAPDRPKKLTKVRRATTKPFKAVFRPIGKFLVKLFRVQPFKTVARVARWIGLIVWPPYIRHSWKELRLVSWPSWKQSRQLTFAVLAFAVVFGGSVAALDFGLERLFRVILLK